MTLLIIVAYLAAGFAVAIAVSYWTHNKDNEDLACCVILWPFLLIGAIGEKVLGAGAAKIASWLRKKEKGERKMKKIIAISAAITALLLTGCNYDVIDTTYSYNRAVIELPNGEIIDGKVQSWRDYEDGDQLQVKIDGAVYLVHSSDAVLIAN